MKNLIITFIGLFVFACASAQPSYNSISMPSIGSSIAVKAKAEYLDEGPSGINQVWDFSDYDTTGSIKSVSYIQSPASTGRSFLEPSSNFAEVTAVGNINFSLINSSENVMLGNYMAATDIYIDYSDPVLTIKAPMAFQDTYTDDFAATYSYQGTDIVKTGTMTVDYDGCGTLITPLGTYNNVIRFHATRTDHDSYGWMSQTTVSNSYAWYLPGSPYSFFAITHTSMSNPLGGTVESDLVMLYEMDQVSGTKKPFATDVKFMISPNPATDYIRVNFQDTKPYEVSLINEFGIVVYNTQVSSNARINTLGLPSGVYLLKVNSSDAVGIRKVVIK